MNTRRWPLGVFGLVLVLLGGIFALQGADVIGGSSMMSGNSSYVYLGVLLLVIGFLMIIVSAFQSEGQGPVKERTV